MDDHRPDRLDHLRPSRLPLLALAVVVAAAAGYAFLRWQRQASSSGAPAAPSAEAPVPPAPPAPETHAVTPAPDAATTRALLEALSPLDAFRRFVAHDEAVRRIAVVTDNLAEGVSPRRWLGAFAPGEPFSVASEGGTLVASPASYRRYDRIAEAVAALDVASVASAYRTLKTPLEAAYRALGYPDRSLDAVAARALLRLERAPVRDGPIEVVRSEGLYAYADPALEALGPVEKHLLRMGPRNARLVQGKAKALRQALFPTQSNEPAAGAGR